MSSGAEDKRKLSLILTDKRKKDPVGLLRAQRNGTLNEYLREDLAKYGLVASVTPPARQGPASSAGGSGKRPGASTPAQRSSFKVPPSTLSGSTPPKSGSIGGTPGSAASATSTPPPRQGSLKSANSSSLPPPPSPASVCSSSTPPTARPTPGKLSASRFGSYSGGSQSQQQPQQDNSWSSRSEPRGSVANRWQVGAGALSSKSAESSQSSAASGSAGNLTVTGFSSIGESVGHSEGQQTLETELSDEGEKGEEKDQPSKEEDVSKQDIVEQLSEEEEAGAEPVAARDASEKPSSTEIASEASSSIGGIAERFGGVKLRSASSSSNGTPSFGRQGSSHTTGSGAGSPLRLGSSAKGSGGSGRIAELARRFEKEKEETE